MGVAWQIYSFLQLKQLEQHDSFLLSWQRNRNLLAGNYQQAKGCFLTIVFSYFLKQAQHLVDSFNRPRAGVLCSHTHIYATPPFFCFCVLEPIVAYCPTCSCLKGSQRVATNCYKRIEDFASTKSTRDLLASHTVLLKQTLQFACFQFLDTDRSPEICNVAQN